MMKDVATMTGTTTISNNNNNKRRAALTSSHNHFLLLLLLVFTANYAVSSSSSSSPSCCCNHRSVHCRGCFCSRRSGNGKNSNAFQHPLYPPNIMSTTRQRKRRHYNEQFGGRKNMHVALALIGGDEKTLIGDKRKIQGDDMTRLAFWGTTNSPYRNQYHHLGSKVSDDDSNPKEEDSVYGTNEEEEEEQVLLGKGQNTKKLKQQQQQSLKNNEMDSLIQNKVNDNNTTSSKQPPNLVETLSELAEPIENLLCRNNHDDDNNVHPIIKPLCDVINPNEKQSINADEKVATRQKEKKKEKQDGKTSTKEDRERNKKQQQQQDDEIRVTDDETTQEVAQDLSLDVSKTRDKGDDTQNGMSPSSLFFAAVNEIRDNILGDVVVGGGGKGGGENEDDDKANVSNEEDIRDSDNLSSLGVIIDKVRNLLDVASTKLRTDGEPLETQKAYAALLAYLQVSGQIKEQQRARVGSTDDDGGGGFLYAAASAALGQQGGNYCGEGECHECADDDIIGLDEALNYALLANEQDTTTLRSKLQSDKYNFQLIRHDPSAQQPGYVGYYVAISPKHQVALFGLKGTSTIEDAITDFCGTAVTFELDHSPFLLEDDERKEDSEDCDNDDNDEEKEKEKEKEEERRASKTSYFVDGEVGSCSDESTNTTMVKVENEGDTEDGEKGGAKTAYFVAEQEGSQVDGTDKTMTALRCHEGILLSAKRIADDVHPLVEHLLLPMGYRLLIVGHSLGAGAASLLGIILRSRIPSLKENVGTRDGGGGATAVKGKVKSALGKLEEKAEAILPERLVGSDNENGGNNGELHNHDAAGEEPSSVLDIFDDGRKLHVMAFATPAMLDHDSALSCSDFVTSIVNKADIVPRLSVANLLVLREFLKVVSRRVEERELSTIYLMRTIAEGIVDDDDDDDGDDIAKDDMLFTAEELKEEMDRALQKVDLRDPDHLYVPGRVLILYEDWSADGDIIGVPDEDIDEESDEDGEDEAVSGSGVRCLISDGTNAALRIIEMDKRMISDHFLRTSYKKSVNQLLAKELPKKV